MNKSNLIDRDLLLEQVEDLIYRELREEEEPSEFDNEIILAFKMGRKSALASALKSLKFFSLKEPF